MGCKEETGSLGKKKDFNLNQTDSMFQKLKTATIFQHSLDVMKARDGEGHCYSAVAQLVHCKTNQAYNLRQAGEILAQKQKRLKRK